MCFKILFKISSGAVFFRLLHSVFLYDYVFVTVCFTVLYDLVRLVL
jgi:hypothetical protein